MTNQEAMTILKDSMSYSTKENPAKEMNNAIGCFAELNGWTKKMLQWKWLNSVLLGRKHTKTTQYTHTCLRMITMQIMLLCILISKHVVTYLLRGRVSETKQEM